MRYKNPYFKKRKNAHPLEVSCGNCKTSLVVYQKAGKGNLIKMLLPRIIESEIDLTTNEGHLYCPECGMLLARKGAYRKEIPTYWIVRGKVNTKRLDNYQL